MSNAVAAPAAPPVTDIMALIKAMEPGTRRLLTGVTWPEYLTLNNSINDAPNLRLSFADGVLEIMTAGFPHEKYSRLFSALMRVLAEELDLAVEEAGSTTLRLGEKETGAEPDTAFYIQHAQQMIGRDQIDLACDPPPDLVIEIDITHPSYSKHPLYARFGVPEIWRFDGQALQFFWRSMDGYEIAQKSRAFPFLQAAVLAAFIEQSLLEGQTKMLRGFRAWVRANQPRTSTN